MLIFTICARNYLAYALTLRESVLKHEPDADFLIYLSDVGTDDPAIRDFSIAMSDLVIPDAEKLQFRYTILELSTAIKPFCFDHAFDRLGHNVAIFLDPDTELFAPLTAVNEVLAAGASCVLTPHLLAPLPRDGMRPTNSDIVASGAFNLGFVAFSNCPEARAFLSWWGQELVEHCYVKLDEGLFVDQKFVDLAPGFLPRLAIIRDKGYNVAYWNLAHRPVERSDAGWTAGGDPLTFFHFSGVDVFNPGVFSKHQDRFTIANAGAAAELAQNYVEKLEANGHGMWSRTPYPFDRFDDGFPIPLPVRRAARHAMAKVDFSAYDAAFWNAAAPSVDQEPGAPISRLMAGYHALRPDLQIAFPLTHTRGRHDFYDWFIAYGMKEYGLAPQQMPGSDEITTSGVSRLKRFAARLRLRFRR